MCTVILQSGIGNRSRWLRGRRLRDIIQAYREDEVLPALREAEAAANSGLWAAGFVCYEAAGGLDDCLAVHDFSALPLVWFAVFDGSDPLAEFPAATDDFAVGAWQSNIKCDSYLAAVEHIRNLIAAGDTYQVNYTTRLNAAFRGRAESLFSRLAQSQQSRYSAFIDCAEHAICSASPELFFWLEGERLICRPMKGTAPRGLWFDDDLAMRERLRCSAKDRAENAMIVDMCRNDMSRIARLGSVRVTSAFDIEKYPTLYQMTSTVECRTAAPVCDVFRAMFPCASITGAPKVRTMQIIRELEPEPRGVYTGAIGYLGPGRAAQFNVAIRTAVIDRRRGRAQFGVGGGIVWDSEPLAEYAECQTKASILTARVPDFELLETLRFDPQDGYFLLDEHVQRLTQSAEYFDFPADPLRVRKGLVEFSNKCGNPMRVRLRMNRDGEISIDSAPAPLPPQRPWRLKLAERPIDPSDVFLYHKTTHRDIYDAALASRNDCDDVLLWNSRGEMTETAIANVVFELEGCLVTPPVSCGLLSGVFRGHLLRTVQIGERVVRVEDLSRCRRVFAVNSVRQWMEAVVE